MTDNPIIYKIASTLQLFDHKTMDEILYYYILTFLNIFVSIESGNSINPYILNSPLTPKSVILSLKYGSILPNGT